MKFYKKYTIRIFSFLIIFNSYNTALAKQNAFSNQIDSQIENNKYNLQKEVISDIKKKKDTDKINSIADNLEAVFLYKIIDEILPEAKDSRIFGDTNGGSIYRTMLIREYSQILSKEIDLGIKKELIKKENKK